MNNKLRYGHLIALNNTLTSYPDDLPFKQILNMIANYHDEIEVQEDFTDWPQSKLASFIEELSKDIDKGINL